MKYLAFFAILALVACVQALPNGFYDGPLYELKKIEDETKYETTEVAPFRQRRVTCDLLSFESKWLTVNHSACAASCLAQRRRGGRCRDGICVCRN
ncbi:hypothetical protein KM043_014656 [Ampulex compressa]|nr:hypothetical protein KM043_014656 [Ampulex compressa]